MNYTQLTDKKKVEIDILLKQGMSMRQVGLALGISHSTISRYKAGIYKKRKIDINKKYKIFIDYLYSHYDRRNNSIEVCVYMFKKRYRNVNCPSVKQVYNWINKEKININKNRMCYKRRKNKISGGMMKHTKWTENNYTGTALQTWLNSYTKFTTGTLGDWTSSSVATDVSSAWDMRYDNILHRDFVSNSSSYGIRPVITISKSNLS